MKVIEDWVEIINCPGCHSKLEYNKDDTYISTFEQLVSTIGNPTVTIIHKSIQCPICKHCIEVQTFTRTDNK